MTDAEEFESVYETTKRQDGILWLRILGQTHWQFDELPFWVLLSGRDQIEGAVNFLQEALKPLQDMGAADVTVSFITFEGKEECSHGFIKGEKFFSADVLSELYDEPECGPRRYGVFDTEYPDDPWAMRRERQVMIPGV